MVKLKRAMASAILSLFVSVTLWGCGGASFIKPEDIQKLQSINTSVTTPNSTSVSTTGVVSSTSTSGAVCGRVNGSSGVVGGDTKWTVVWGTDTGVIDRLLDWCAPK
jgi:hypothetical protein